MTNESDSVPSRNAEAFTAELRERLRSLRTAAASTVSNPVERFSADLLADLHGGQCSMTHLERVVDRLTADAARHRARRLADYFNTCDSAAMTDELRQAIHAVATGRENGAPVPFETFKGEIEREVLGIVITAHPTFGMDRQLTEAIAAMACQDGGEEGGASLDLSGGAGPPEMLDLAFEHDFAAMVLTNIQAALQRVYAVVLEVAADLYPERWRDLTPRLASVATWVGYDFDGRRDIAWSDTIRLRLDEKTRQLAGFGDRLGELAGRNGAPPALAEKAEALRNAARLTEEDRDAVPRKADDWAATRHFSCRLVDGNPDRLTASGEIAAMLADLAEKADSETAAALSVLRAEIANFGLGTAHIHVRINATQLINAIRGDVGLETAPDESGNRRRYLAALNQCLDTITPVSVNFGSIVGETMSARRTFMVVAQILKHIDGETPIRFLIAEADTSFTILAALYLARLFGVDDRLDISPLFETADAFERGHEVIGELLDNSRFRDYVRRRGRLCIQTGFSDGGRYIGQVAAALAVERLHVKLVGVLKEKDLAGEVELVIFDTHGESIGRGRHPRSLEDSLDYIYTPLARENAACAGVPVKHELSFQGADGYVYFATPEIAFATVCTLLSHTLQPAHQPCAALAEIRQNDQLYRDADYSLDFFLTVKAFNEALIEDRDYGALLRPGENLLYKTGSRPVSRQYTGGAPPSPLDIRAISHNGVLQQLGFFANSVGGVGTAIAKDVERFQEVFAGSPRLERLTALVAGAWTLSDVDAFRAYIDLFDPLRWLDRAWQEPEEPRRHALQRLSALLAESGLHEGLSRLGRGLIDDGLDLESVLGDMAEYEALVPESLRACREDLALLHGIRLTLLKEILILAARLPRFTPEEDVTIDQVIREILQFNVPAALEILNRAFPVATDQPEEEGFGEAATYRPSLERGYEREHRELFRPLRQLYDVNRRISIAVSHFMGAVG